MKSKLLMLKCPLCNKHIDITNYIDGQVRGECCCANYHHSDGGDSWGFGYLISSVGELEWFKLYIQELNALVAILYRENETRIYIDSKDSITLNHAVNIDIHNAVKSITNKLKLYLTYR